MRKKQAAAASIETHRSELVALSDQVWAFAETALREKRSAAVLADYAEKQGFKVERGVAGMPTAFVASYGEGAPVIAVLGEYDALPGLSQKATADKQPLAAGAAGHGCGHNLFGAASLGAATAIKELIAAGSSGARSASTARPRRRRSAARRTWRATASSRTSTWRSPGTPPTARAPT